MAPRWDDIGKKKVSPPGPLAEVATALADREVARLPVDDNPQGHPIQTPAGGADRCVCATST